MFSHYIQLPISEVKSGSSFTIKAQDLSTKMAQRSITLVLQDEEELHPSVFSSSVGLFPSVWVSSGR